MGAARPLCMQRRHARCSPRAGRRRLPTAAGLIAAAAARAAPAAAAAGTSIWETGQPQGHVEVRDDVPGPLEFFDLYLKNTGGPFDGVGKPVLFRGAARQMPAYRLWTDEYLRKHHGAVRMDQVETEKKETRTKYPHEDWTLAQFLDVYNTSEVYSTATTPPGLASEVFLLPPMNCGGGLHERLSSTVLWFSSGRTKSVVHSDSQQNFHCMFAGEKRWMLWHPQSKVDTEAMGWVHDAEEEAKKDPSFKDAYGSFAGHVDVERVDLERFPGWASVPWWNLTLGEGDCAFLPRGWFHFVEAPAQRSISVHVWFHSGRAFEAGSCEALRSKGHDPSAFLLRLSDCTWGYGEEGSRARTRCKFPRAPREL